MQLSTDTMRSSLDSDWKLLSDEAKALLIDTCMKARPADQQMLDEIRRADNPSRCSCAQIAPDDYEADTGCCARGIELVFTWRKNGNLEVRFVLVLRFDGLARVALSNVRPLVPWSSDAIKWSFTRHVHTT